MKTKQVIAAATKAYVRGNCLDAGQLIDKAYRLVGRGRVPKALAKLDSKFERTCVKKRPSLGEARYPLVKNVSKVTLRRGRGR